MSILHILRVKVFRQCQYLLSAQDLRLAIHKPNIGSTFMVSTNSLYPYKYLISHMELTLSQSVSIEHLIDFLAYNRHSEKNS